jgi:TonB family protein
MWRHLLLFLVAAPLVCLENVQAQSAFGSDTPQVGVVLSKLSEPAYPPLARQARIAGDVDLMLAIRRDGSVESAAVISGHPMLTQAALDSAKQSKFECRGCGNALTSYALKYTFQFVPGDPPKDCDQQMTEAQPHAEVDSSHAQVKVFTRGIWTCDPTTTVTFLLFRSAKCLYLWRCGRRLVDK